MIIYYYFRYDRTQYYMPTTNLFHYIEYSSLKGRRVILKIRALLTKRKNQFIVELIDLLHDGTIYRS